ncbi:hypothetical protein EOS93_23170 [Rhizobium sp. RMa-01]|uniref:hypothetical protein n=1 Tax=unclassified Rhizobium TaxID=2613769 RepID=UPI0008DA157D|nr:MULTISPECIES: hypothetical protein [unclassified Rhizobium]RVU08815.1 hypothetical protein EOS93_23170 [Rhizobium sp. RMa-01]
MADKKNPLSLSGALPWGASVAAEVLSGIGVPGGNLLANYVDAFQQKKRKEATDILIEQITAGKHGPVNFTEDDVDPFIAATLRFARAVEIGAAHDNLVLLAQVIAGLKRQKALTVDAFMRWAGVLEQMTRDELMILGLAYRAQKFNNAESRAENATVWPHVIGAMTNAGYGAGDIQSLAACVSRYGLLTPSNDWNSAGYDPTGWLMELGDLADLELVSAAGR